MIPRAAVPGVLPRVFTSASLGARPSVVTSGEMEPSAVSEESVTSHKIPTIWSSAGLLSVLQRTMGASLAYSKWANCSRLPRPSDRLKSIALFNNKGGVSKTTTTFNPGWILAKRGHRVILSLPEPVPEAKLPNPPVAE